jgi:hypothetical protein
MDTIKDHLYGYYISGQRGDGWDEDDAKQSSQLILEVIEEYQSLPDVRAWRASD